MIGQGGWADFKFLFAGANQAIYAVDELRDEPNRYEIEGHLERMGHKVTLEPTAA